MTFIVIAALAACSTKDATPPEPTPRKAAEPSQPPPLFESPAAHKDMEDNAHADLAAKLDDTRLAALHAAAKCDDPASPQRVWCIAADGWATAKAAPLPAGATTLVGLTLKLADDASVDQALIDDVSLAALDLRQDGGRQLAKITDITPSNADETQAIGAAVMNLAALFKGKATVAEIPKGLADYVATLAATASYEAHADGVSWTWAGAQPAEARKVGDTWVTIETATNGLWVSVFTDRIQSATK